MGQTRNSTLNYYTIFTMLIFMLFSLFLIQDSSGVGVYIFVAFNFFIMFFLAQVAVIKDVTIFLLMLVIFPFAIISSGLHGSISLIIIQDLPYVFLIFTSLLILVQSKNETPLLKTKYSQIAFLFFLYCIFSAAIGFVKGQNHTDLFLELYNISFYFSPVLLVVLFKKEAKFEIIFNVIITVVTILSLEFIYHNVFTDKVRFVTFQVDFHAVVVGYLFAHVFFMKERRIYYVPLLLINFIGLLITMTRALWVAGAISIGIIIYFYLLEKGLSKKLLNTIAALIFVLGVFVVSNIQVDKSNITAKVEASSEYKAKSIADPLEDSSFLMRVELGFYMFQKFLSSPIIGKGLGDTVNYKFLGNPDVPILYPDNSYLYFLWKTGLIGLILFLLVYFLFLRQCFRVWKKIDNIHYKLWALGIFAGTIGNMVYALLNGNLIKYPKINLLMAICILFIEYNYRKLNEK